jgi:hypothetical protein
MDKDKLMRAAVKIFAQISEIHEGKGRFPIKLVTIPSGNARSHEVSNALFDPKIDHYSTSLTLDTSFDTFNTNNCFLFL